jgi:SAM-dependent methyltransferase
MTVTDSRTVTRVLNVGAGSQDFGDVRVDAVPTGTAVHAVADAEHLPFKASSFSVVYSNCVLEHLRNPGTGLDEMFRVLAPGGTLDLTTDHAAYWAFHLLMDHSTHYTRGRDRHYSLYAPGHLRAHCEAAGFRVLKLKLEYNLSGTWRLVDRVIRVIPFLGIFTSWRIHVQAVKSNQGPISEPAIEGGRALRLSLKLFELSQRVRKGE